MADLLVKAFYTKKVLKTGTEVLQPRKMCVCSACNEVIYAPSNGMWYAYCYNCGAKFDRPISAKYIKQVKESVKL